MAPGLLLWFIWICSLLLNGSVCLPAIKGYGYPYVSDWRNIGDDGDEVLNSAVPTWQASNNHGSGYNTPSVAQWTDLVPTSQNLPNTPSTHDQERLVSGASRDWGLDNVDKPLVFPLRPNNQLSDPAKPQPSPIQPQSSASLASTSGVPFSLNAGGSTEYALSYPPQASSHSVANHGAGNQNIASSADGGGSHNTPRLVFEEVFHYPKNTDALSAQSYGDVSSTVGGYSVANEMGPLPDYASTLENSPFSSYPPNVGTHSAYPSEMVTLDSSQPYYQPLYEGSYWLKQEPVLSTQEAEVSGPILPLSSSYIIQSRNGYQRGRYRVSKSRYTPEFRFPITFSPKGVKSTAPSRPAAPKGVKNPERTNW
ncbi:hypothetical protein PAMP_009226 [Pampus punctatissimus]